MSELVKGRPRMEAELLLRQFLSLMNRREAAPPQGMSPEWRAVLDTLNRFPARVRCATLPWTTLEMALQKFQP
jgi:NifU-like protein involved in Fe-S cluster formation